MNRIQIRFSKKLCLFTFDGLGTPIWAGQGQDNHFVFSLEHTSTTTDQELSPSPLPRPGDTDTRIMNLPSQSPSSLSDHSHPLVTSPLFFDSWSLGLKITNPEGLLLHFEGVTSTFETRLEFLQYKHLNPFQINFLTPFYACPKMYTESQ